MAGMGHEIGYVVAFGQFPGVRSRSVQHDNLCAGAQIRDERL